MTFSVNRNPDGTWSVRDGGAVIGPFATWEQASTYVLERERAWRDADTAAKAKEKPLDTSGE